MVKKNTERRSNEYTEGECDLFLNKTVFDNKCSWSLDTFPMFENECQDQKYEDQLNVYAWLWDAEKMTLCYTLIDAPYEMVSDAIKWENDPDKKYKIAERMIYTEKYFNEIKEEFFQNSTRNTFIEIPEEKRIKTFNFIPDLNFRKDLKLRVKLCRTYINSLLNK